MKRRFSDAERKQRAASCRARYRRENRSKVLLMVKLANRKRLGLPEPLRPEPEVCECCGQKCHRALSLDHDHSTGTFRGWLCQGCNVSIGRLGDTIAGVQRAVDYLNRVSR